MDKFLAQSYDAVVAAISKLGVLGAGQMEAVVTEVGWPSGKRKRSLKEISRLSTGWEMREKEHCFLFFRSCVSGARLDVYFVFCARLVFFLPCVCMYTAGCEF